ncbi:MAG TPA: hypothetical protein VM429_07105 [Micropruina sp.]|nr:hypothetical protein [Micropruina sp.]
MPYCEACGRTLSESDGRCSACGRPVPVTFAAGHLSRVAIAGNPGPIQYASTTPRTVLDFTPPPAFSSAQTSEPHPDVPDGAEADDADDADDADQDPSGEDYDPDATTRFMPAYASRTNAKNTAALVALAVALIAAVSSLAWLIGASVTAARPTARPSVAASPTSTPISTAVPKNATVCTPEVARSTNTSCTLARRVFSAVRTLGTDLPNTFRVTVTDPQTAKNATFVCSIKSWIQCVGSSDVTVYVQRQV